MESNTLKRLSMNTSLKNARIFDDDAWDENDQPIVKKEIKQEFSSDSSSESSSEGEEEDTKANLALLSQKIKKEPISDNEEDIPTPGQTGQRHKTPPKLKIKLNNIKTEPDDVPVDRKFDESPYNKELFNSLKIKEETPVKSENEVGNGTDLKTQVESAKRSVFSRLSPVENTEVEGKAREARVPAKRRLGPRVNSTSTTDDDDCQIPQKKRRKPNLETDPAVISRREKQIEYGKNTRGYENYCKMVARKDRTADDPKTPPKQIQYSRRAWEGLIKQWRIKLHKYDPPDEAE